VAEKLGGNNVRIRRTRGRSEYVVDNDRDRASEVFT
jgi:hypothetical protein